MLTSRMPDPILNSKEIALEKRLIRNYEKFCEPSFVGRIIDRTKQEIGKRIPTKLKTIIASAGEKINEVELIEDAFKYAGESYSELLKYGAKTTLSKKSIVKKINLHDRKIKDFKQIPFTRSYHIQSAVEKAKLRRLLLATAEGAVTGAGGVLGIPFNIAFSFFLFFRATQSIALSYGYDVQNDPAELAIASEITLQCLEPRLVHADSKIGATLTKLMLTSELSSLGTALGKNLPYKVLIENGGLQKAFVQLRAFGHASAKKALKNSGRKTLEAGFLKGILEKVGIKMSKEFAAKSIPFISAFFGAGIDTYLMNRVLKGSDLVYHKRFLAEKAIRIKTLLDCESSRRSTSRKRIASKQKKEKKALMKPSARK